MRKLLCTAVYLAAGLMKLTIVVGTAFRTVRKLFARSQSVGGGMCQISYSPRNGEVVVECHVQALILLRQLARQMVEGGLGLYVRDVLAEEVERWVPTIPSFLDGSRPSGNT